MTIYKETQFRKYDLKKHRWTITTEYITSEFGIDLNTLSAIKEDVNPNTAAQRFINLLSGDLYRYIYEHAFNREITEYLLASNEEWAEEFQEALGLYVYSAYLSGNLFSLETGLSLDNGKELEQKDISIQHIPTSVKEVLETADILFRGKRIGYNLDDIRALKAEGEF